MNIQRTLSIFIFLLSVPYLEAQNTLESGTNMIRSGDSIVCRQIEYFSPGNMGEGQIWDFQELEYVDNDFITRYICDTDSITIHELLPSIRRKYQSSEDSLFTLGYETRLHTVTYEEPINLLNYPFAYGSHIRQDFHGTGTYSKKYVIESRGTVETEADAAGTIYINGTDTLRNVLRIHRIFSSCIFQYLPSDKLIDTTNVRQRIEEHYLWYARGYRYPVLETISTTIYNDMVPVSCQQTAYCTLPSDQIHLKDSVNAGILLEDSLENNSSSEVPPIHYQVTVMGNGIDISYTLDVDATIQVLLCDRMGLIYKRASTSGNAGETNCLHIDNNGLRSGVYILYISVNGQIFNKIIAV